jgi:hypothetical protein
MEASNIKQQPERRVMPPELTRMPEVPPPRRARRQDLFAPELVMPALKQSFVMLRPDIQWANPVMFVVEPGSDYLLHCAGRLAVDHRPVCQLCNGIG